MDSNQNWLEIILTALAMLLPLRFWRLLLIPLRALLGKLEEKVVEEVAEAGMKRAWKCLRKWMSRNHKSKKHHKPERKPMSSNKQVRFICVDAPKPVKVGGTVALGAPLDLDYQAGLEYGLDLGFTCDVPLLLIPTSKVDVSGYPVIPAGHQAKVKVTAKLDGRIGRGERILFAVPLGLVDFDLG